MPTSGSEGAGSSGRPMLRVSDLRARYGRIEVLHGVALEVHAGEIVALLGANGAGKTTLLRALVGEAETRGEIEFEGASICGLPAWERIRRGLGVVPEGRQVWPELSVLDNLRLGSYMLRGGAGEDELERILRRFPVLREKARQPAGMLSGGQQQMLAIGRALAGRPRLLLLDEPSMGLAPLLVSEIIEVVRQLRDEGVTSILVEQNAVSALRICDRAYVLETGRIAFEGSGPDLLADPRVQASYLGI